MGHAHAAIKTQIVGRENIFCSNGISVLRTFRVQHLPSIRSSPRRFPGPKTALAAPPQPIRLTCSPELPLLPARPEILSHFGNPSPVPRGLRARALRPALSPRLAFLVGVFAVGPGASRSATLYILESHNKPDWSSYQIWFNSMISNRCIYLETAGPTQRIPRSSRHCTTSPGIGRPFCCFQGTCGSSRSAGNTVMAVSLIP